MINSNKNYNTTEVSELASGDASQRLFTKLRREIETGKLYSGDKLQSVRKLAHTNELSFEAVRKVLKRLEVLDLVASKRGSGTYVTGAGSEDHPTVTNTVLLMMDAYGHIYRNISEGLIGKLQGDGFSCIKFADDEMNLGKVSKSVLNNIDKWIKYPPHAVVVTWADTELFRKLDLLHAAGSRIISLFGSHLSRPHWDHVGTNIEIQAALTAKRLISHGHQRIGLITHHRDRFGIDPNARRKLTVGHTALIVSLGHELRERLGRKGALTVLYNYSDRKPIGSEPLSPENIARAAEWLSGPNRPTAVVGEDFRLVGIIKAAQKIGLRIPEDLELLGIGNTPWSKAYEFTSIALNEPAIVQRITEIIAHNHDADKESTHRILVTPYIEGCTNDNINIAGSDTGQ